MTDMERHCRIGSTEPAGTPPCCKAERLTPAGLGVLLGALNVVVIAIGMAASVGHGDVLGVAFFVALVGILPGVVTGACLGALAGSLRAQAPWLRLVVLLSPALLLVCALGATFDLLGFVGVSGIPTAVAVLILERSTRERVEPVVPPARAR